MISDILSREPDQTIVILEVSEDTVDELQEQFPVPEGEEPSIFLGVPGGTQIALGDVFLEDAFVLEGGAAVSGTVALG